MEEITKVEGSTFPFEDGMAFGSVTRITNGYIGLLPNGEMFVIPDENSIEASFETLGAALAAEIVNLLDNGRKIVNFSVMVSADDQETQPTSLDGSAVRMIAQMLGGLNPLAQKTIKPQTFKKVNPLAGLNKANDNDDSSINAAQLKVINTAVEKGDEVVIRPKNKKHY